MAGCCCSAPWRSASTHVAGWCLRDAAGSALSPRTRSSGRSRGSRVKAGGCTTRCRGAGVGTSTRSLSLHRRGIRNRNENQYPRGPARCSCARTGDMAIALPAAMVQARCAAGRVPCSTSRGRARRGRSAGGVDRAACGGSACVRRPVRSSGLPAVRSPGCPGRGEPRRSALPGYHDARGISIRDARYRCRGPVPDEPAHQRLLSRW